MTTQVGRSITVERVAFPTAEEPIVTPETDDDVRRIRSKQAGVVAVADNPDQRGSLLRPHRSRNRTGQAGSAAILQADPGTAG
jgi:hypothetical protein